MSRENGSEDEALTRAQLRAERAHLQRLRVSEAGVALAALLVSLTVLGVNFFNHRRGSEMVVLQPEQIALYREESGAAAGPGTVWLAVQAPMVNAAREHGDVVVRASAFLGERGGEEVRFAFNALIEPVMSRDVERRVENCPESARCLPATGFYVIERPKKLLDVPGGSSRTEFLAFQLETSNCEPAAGRYCQSLGDYASVAAFLRAQKTVAVQVDIEFQFDGVKTLECAWAVDGASQNAILDYLDQKGWAMPACVKL